MWLTHLDQLAGNSGATVASLFGHAGAYGMKFRRHKDGDICEDPQRPKLATPDLQVTDRTRCRHVSELPVANVNNVVEMPPIERQLYGTSAAKIFLVPESGHPWAPAVGRMRVPLWLNEGPHCCRWVTGSNDRNLAVNLNFYISGYAALTTNSQSR